jgi:hypothetical protein
MFEHLSQPIISKAEFFMGFLFHAACALAIVGGALGIGILGYHEFEGFSWIDSILNASMILGGMRPIGELHSNADKLFASCYALFAGLAFVIVMGILFAPFLHRFRLDLEDKDE